MSDGGNGKKGKTCREVEQKSEIEVWAWNKEAKKRCGVRENESIGWVAQYSEIDGGNRSETILDRSWEGKEYSCSWRKR